MTFCCRELFPQRRKEDERALFNIEDLVKWRTQTTRKVSKARADPESWRRTCADNADHPRAKELFDPNKLSPSMIHLVVGHSLEAQALRQAASDLNPVAVLTNSDDRDGSCSLGAHR